jgi:hypothetical protein
VRGTIILFTGMLTFLSVPVGAEPPPRDIRETYLEHTRAVELARNGRHDEGLTLLGRLLRDFPDDYPLQRDFILITIWKGDCDAALERFQRVRQAPHPPYLAVPVSDCLLEQGRPREALAVVRSTLAWHPDDAALRHAETKISVALMLDTGVDEQRPMMEFEFLTDASDQGLREWLSRIEGSARVATRTRLYARYLVTHASDAQYASGDLHRVGLGARYRFDERWRLDQEFSQDLQQGGRGGSATRLDYEPYDTWRFHAGYTTYAEDIPLRARATGIEARRADAASEYNSVDYRWYGLASVNQYDFSDTNRRSGFFTTLGYAYEMQPAREQRLFLEWYQSRNSLEDAGYFNPRRDHALGLTHKTDFIHASRFKRHVDHLYLSVSSYYQEGFGAHGRGGVRYEQEYDFDHNSALLVGAGYFHNVYDASYENETRLELRYRRRF